MTSTLLFDECTISPSSTSSFVMWRPAIPRGASDCSPRNAEGASSLSHSRPDASNAPDAQTLRRELFARCRRPCSSPQARRRLRSIAVAAIEAGPIASVRSIAVVLVVAAGSNVATGASQFVARPRCQRRATSDERRATSDSLRGTSPRREPNCRSRSFAHLLTNSTAVRCAAVQRCRSKSNSFRSWYDSAAEVSRRWRQRWRSRWTSQSKAGSTAHSRSCSSNEWCPL